MNNETREALKRIIKALNTGEGWRLEKEIHAVENWLDETENTFYRINGECGVYILTKNEMDIALDRENTGVVGTVIAEKDYGECKNKDSNGNACYDCEMPTGSPCGSTSNA